MSFMGKIDGDTQYVGSKYVDNPEIDHAASAKENLKEVGQDLKKAFTPDKIAGAIDMIRSPKGGDIGAGFGVALGVLALPWMAVADVAEVAIMPIAAVKDAADAAIHGIVAGFKKIF